MAAAYKKNKAQKSGITTAAGKPPVQVILVTGFLGTGKTTLINALVKRLSAFSLGVLVNDFGKVPLDGAIIRNAATPSEKKDSPAAPPENDQPKAVQEQDGELSIYEIGNGSIFCSCLKASFIYGLTYFKTVHPQILIIETSGLSDPSGFSRILSEQKLEEDFKILSILCAVDPGKFIGLSKHFETPKRQAQAADRLLIGKTDLVNRQEIQQTALTLMQLNPSAVIEYGSFGEFPLLGLLQGESKDQQGEWESCNTIENRQAPIFLTIPSTGKSISKHELEEFYRTISGNIFRMKGVLPFEGEPFLVSDSGPEITFSPLQSGAFRGFPGLTVFCETHHQGSIISLWEKLYQ